MKTAERLERDLFLYKNLDLWYDDDPKVIAKRGFSRNLEFIKAVLGNDHPYTKFYFRYFVDNVDNYLAGVERLICPFTGELAGRYQETINGDPARNAVGSDVIEMHLPGLVAVLSSLLAQPVGEPQEITLLNQNGRKEFFAPDALITSLAKKNGLDSSLQTWQEPNLPEINFISLRPDPIRLRDQLYRSGLFTLLDKALSGQLHYSRQILSTLKTVHHIFVDFDPNYQGSTASTGHSLGYDFQPNLTITTHNQWMDNNELTNHGQRLAEVIPHEMQHILDFCLLGRNVPANVSATEARAFTTQIEYALSTNAPPKVIEHLQAFAEPYFMALLGYTYKRKYLPHHLDHCAQFTLSNLNLMPPEKAGLLLSALDQITSRH